MIYLDTSFLTPLFRAEPASEQVANCIARLPADGLAISQWTRVEFASVIAREVRMRTLSEMQARTLLNAFDALTESSLHIWLPAAADFQRAHDFVAQFDTGLRAPDALHLAIAHNHGAETVLSLDEGLILAAKRLGLSAGQDMTH